MATRHGRPDVRWNAVPVVAPAAEPISVDDVQAHRQGGIPDDQNALIQVLITTAREYAENYTGRAFITQKQRVTLDGFPGMVIPPTPFAAVAAWLPTPQPSPEIPIERGPLQSVDAIKYVDTDGNLQTLDPSTYVVDTSGIVARIAPAYGQNWPDTRDQIAAVTIDVTLGYGDTAAQVPAGIRHWLLLRVGTIFENREEVAILNRGKVEALPFVDGLLDPYRVPVI